MERRRARTVAWLVGCAGLIAAQPVATSQDAEVVPEEIIPFQDLDLPVRTEVIQVTRQPTITRVVENRTVDCSTDVYRYLLENLPLASVVARQMELGKFVIVDNEDGTFAVDDKEGAFAKCERILETSGKLIIIARGYVEPPLVSRVHGTGVTVISYRADSQDPPRLVADCHIFFRLGNDFLHLVTRPFRHRLGQYLQTRFMGLVECATKVAEAVTKDPFGVYQAMRDSGAVSREKLEEFKRLFLVKKKT